MIVLFISCFAPVVGELEPVAKLENFDNDGLNGNEFLFQTISGV